MSFLEFVNAKYEELLEMMKSSKEERKALKDENKILKESLLLLLHQKSKLIILWRMSVNYWEWILLKMTFQ